MDGEDDVEERGVDGEGGGGCVCGEVFGDGAWEAGS